MCRSSISTRHSGIWSRAPVTRPGHDGETFPFPAGGTGELWNRIAGLLPGGRIRLKSEIADIDPHKKIARAACGQSIGYEYIDPHKKIARAACGQSIGYEYMG
jgi:hypothetical protein